MMNSELPIRGLMLKRLLFWVAVYAALGLAVYGGFRWLQHEFKTEEVLPAGNIELNVPKVHFETGEAITFTLTNHFPTPVYVENSCPQEPLTVYRWEDSQWQRIHAEIDKDDCPNQSRHIEIDPESSVSGSYGLWSELFEKPGQYRIVAVIDHYAAIPYIDFEVYDPVQAEPEPAPAPVTHQEDTLEEVLEDAPHEAEEEHEREQEPYEAHEEDDD